MEHKTEVDLPFTVGSTASLTRMLFLAAQRHRERHKHACKQVVENHTFSMNYKCTPYFFFLKCMTKRPYFTGGGEKKIISTETDDGLLCWRQNSCNRNGNVLPPSDHVRFEMHSAGGNLSYRAFLFPSSLSLWQLLITRWDAERGLFRA